MIQASAYVIKSKIPEYSWLGIVRFNETAVVMKNLTQLSSKSKRNEILMALPNANEYGGRTCIGCGIEKALEVKVPLIHSNKIYQ